MLVVGEVAIPERELQWRFSRSAGPGGQSVNTTDSRVELVWDLVGSDSLPDHLRERARARLSGRLVSGRLVVVAASEYRSQLRNRDAARRRLADLLESAFAPPTPRRRRTRPTVGSRERRLAAKRRRSDVKANRRRPDV